MESHKYTGWCLSHPSEKNIKVGWDYYSHYMEKKHMFQTTNQYGGGL